MSEKTSTTPRSVSRLGYPLLIGAIAGILSACSSDDGTSSNGSGGNEPVEYQITLDSIDATDKVKTFKLGWTDQGTEGTYQICRYDVSHENSCDSLKSGVTGTTTDVVLPSLMHDDQYFIRNETTKTQSEPTTPSSDQLIAAAGYFKASNPGINDRFGRSVDIETQNDGTTLMAVGASLEDGSPNSTVDGYDDALDSAGAVYLYTKTTDGEWQFTQYLKPFEYAHNSGGSEKYKPTFGASVSLSETGTMVVGAPGHERKLGAAYIFEKTADESQWYHRMTYSYDHYFFNEQGVKNRRKGDQTILRGHDFGVSTAISSDGKTIVVGAKDWDFQTEPENGNRGGAYVLQWNQTSDKWERSAHISVGSEGDHPSMDFGAELALSDDGTVLAVGDPLAAITEQGDESRGAVYLFRAEPGDTEEDTPKWAEIAHASPGESNAADEVITSNDGQGVYLEQFGSGLSISDDGKTLAVAAFKNAEYSTGVNGEVSGDVTGDLTECTANYTCIIDAGAVYIFADTGEGWAQDAYIKPEVVNPYGMFGSSIGLSGDGLTLAVGMQGDDNTKAGIGLELLSDHPGALDDAEYGSISLYVRGESGWSLKQYAQIPFDFSPGVRLGNWSLDMSDDGDIAISSADDSSFDGVTTLSTGKQNNQEQADSGAVILF